MNSLWKKETMFTKCHFDRGAFSWRAPISSHNTIGCGGQAKALLLRTFIWFRTQNLTLPTFFHEALLFMILHYRLHRIPSCTKRSLTIACNRKSFRLVTLENCQYFFVCRSPVAAKSICLLGAAFEICLLDMLG